MKPADIAQARADTPASSTIIHFNNAGSSLIPLPVQKAVTAYQEAEYNLGGYETYDKHLPEHLGVYQKLATLIGAAPEEIVLTTGASHSYGIAIQSLGLVAGDKVLCCYAEYVSNYMALLLQQQRGIELVVIPNDAFGQIDVEALEAAIDNRTRLISLTHIPTSGGLINPAAAVGKIASGHGITYILDACQSVGQLDIDVKEIQCDILVATGRKYLRAPRGTGFLFVRKDLLGRMTPAIVDGWSCEWTALNEFQYRPGRSRMELYERNYAALLGLGEAAAYAAAWGTKNIEVRNIALGKLLRERLSHINGVQLHDRGEKLGSIVTFEVKGKDHEKIMHDFRCMKIHLSMATGVGARLDLGVRGIHSLLRASLHYYNTEDEISTFARQVEQL